MKECVLKKFDNVGCYYDETNTPMLLYDPFFSPGFAACAGSKTRKINGDIRAIARALALGFSPSQPAYWKEREIRLNYEGLKSTMVQKAKRENLEPCQMACLVTCVSSRIIEYCESGVSTSLEAIQSGAGVCREFTLIAQDISESLGLETHYASGNLYDVDRKTNLKKRTSTYGHVVLGVKINGANYLIDPQSPTCQFSNPQFSAIVEKPRLKKLNIK